MSISTHVLDGVGGRPAVGVPVRLYARDELVADTVTDADGRCLLTDGPTQPGPHRLVFATGQWFAGQGQDTFYPEVVVSFAVSEPAGHHHVPLLLAPYAYSTYRGS
jgi:5-hydroxyisourate hydrolase